MQFGVLGPLAVWKDGRELPLGPPKQRAVLAVLLLRANEFVPTARLVDELWGGRPPPRAVKAVQVYVSQLRKAIGDGVVETRPAGYVLRVKAGALDLHRFESLLDEGRTLLATDAAAEAAGVLRSALALWRGPALADVQYESFARNEIGRLEELRLLALTQRLEADLELGRHAETVPELEALVREHPTRESLLGLLMLALYRAGRQADALAAYHDARTTLVDELGLDPIQSLQQLEKAILLQDPSLDLTLANNELPPLPTLEDRSTNSPATTAVSSSQRERKVVTVLFADLIGLTARAELLDPEDVEAILEPVHARLRSELERFGGTVETFIGDAVMAFFGATVAHEDDPERAVRSALAIRDWASDEEVEVRVAVNTGEALVRLGARTQPGEGMVTGDVVNTAARLQAAAPANGILVGEATYRATRDRIEYRDREPVATKGKAAQVAVWEAVQARSRVGMDLEQRTLTPLVGRAEELSLLVDSFARARRRCEPQLVTLIGVPGIGKSRLVAELFQRLDAAPDLVWWRQGRALPYGEGVSFWALGEIVKAQAGIQENDGAQMAAKKLRASVGAAVDESDVERIAAHLRPLVGLGTDGTLEREASFGAWRRYLEGLAEKRPLVLVFEDLHWADEGLLDFVDHLADWASGVPLLVLATARPELLERRPSWGGGKLNATTLELSPLADEEAARLLVGLLDRTLLPAETLGPLLERAGGNPLYAEQFARLYLERGSVEDLPLPENVQGIIAARLDGLQVEEKRLLQDAAVLGKVFWSGGVAALTGVERPIEVLHALERQGFVGRERRSAVSGQDEYAFRHVLVREVAYGQIPRASRTDKHVRAAKWMESLGRPDDHAEMLAYHYGEALAYVAGDDSELRDRARHVFRAAADRALSLNAYAGAIDLYRRALADWPDDAERVEIVLGLGRSRYYGEEAGDEELAHARDALLAAGKAARAVEPELLLGNLVGRRGDADLAAQHLERARSYVDDTGDSPAKLAVLTQQASHLMLSGHHEQAILSGREVLALAERLGDDEARAQMLITVGTSRVSLGDTGGRVELEQAIELARRLDSTALPRVLHNMSSVCSMRGDLRSAQIWNDEAAAAAARLGLVWRVRWQRANALDLFFEGGRWDEALADADAFIAQVEAGSPHLLEGYVRIVRARILLARDQPSDALADAARALAQGEAAGDAWVLNSALAACEAIFFLAGDFESAHHLAERLVQVRRTDDDLDGIAMWVLEQLVDHQALTRVVKQLCQSPWRTALEAILSRDHARAAEIYAEIGSLPLEAFFRLRAAETLATEGRHADADAQLRQALAFYRSVGAARFVREGETLLAATA